MYIENKQIKKNITIWLNSMFWIVSFMIVVGGLTRLTDSGLSITQWQLFSGILPPMNEIQWNQYFDLYKKIPEICGTEDPTQLIKEFDKIWLQLDQVFEDMVNQFKQVILKVFRADPNISDMDFVTIKEWAKKIGAKDPFSAKINEFKKENDWIEQIISYAASKPASEWNDHDFQEATLKIEEMARHFIMSYRLYTLREKHSDTKIIDIAIFDGQKPERSSKFYKFKTDNSSVEKVTEDVMKLLEDKKLSESEKGEVVLKVLKKIMSFDTPKKGKIIA